MRGATAGRYVAVVAVGLLVLRAFGPAWRSGYPISFPDSSSYLDVAARGVLSPSFWIAPRPPTYPLLIWLVGPSARAIVLAQLVVAVAAWGWLISTAWQQLRHRAIAAATVILLVGVAVQSRWALWHSAVLTESLSGSLAVAGIAAWWRWFADPSRFRLVAATAITGAWMLLRDANAVTFAVVALPALLVSSVLEHRRTGPRRRGVGAALVALLLVAAFSAVGQVVTDRGETSFHNNVGLRWLVDEEMTAWMTARGMPMSDALRERTGSDAWSDGEAFLRSPELEAYRDWADGRGRVAAASSFVLRADWYLDRLWRELPRYAASDYRAYDSFAVSDRLPERPLGPLDPVASRPSMVFWTLATLAAAIAVARFDRRSAWLIPFLVVPVSSDLYLSYVADAVEVGRHLVGPLLRFAAVSIVAVALGIDAVVAASTRSPASGHPDSQEPVDVAT